MRARPVQKRSAPNRANSVRPLPDSDELFIMTSEWLSGAFTALGAVLGAGATLATGLIGTRSQRGLAEANRKGQIAEVRREAYAEYLTAVYSFMDRARELIAMLDANADMTERDAARHVYLEDWDRLQPKYAPVVVAGPGQIEGSAESLRFCVADLADQCDKWYMARKAGSVFRDTEKTLNAQSAAIDARSKFISAARDHVYG
jgi:hypothetical protein